MNAVQASGSASASATIAVDLLEDVLEDRADQRLLGGEAAVERALADPGAAGDLLDADVQPGLGEGGARGVQDARAVAGGVGPQGADMGLHCRRSYIRSGKRARSMQAGVPARARGEAVDRLTDARDATELPHIWHGFDTFAC